MACVASPFGSTYVTSSGCPLIPPLALVRCTTRSVLTRISAPSMAPTPVTSSMTPTLIGDPLGLAAAAVGLPCACGADVAGAVVGAAAAGGLVGAGGGVAAGDEHAASTQATEPTSKA